MTYLRFPLRKHGVPVEHWLWRNRQTAGKTLFLLAAGLVARDHYLRFHTERNRTNALPPAIFPIRDARPLRYTVTDLGLLPSGTESTAFAVNNTGQVAGYATVAIGDHPRCGRAFLWEKGVMRDLGALDGGGSLAYNISNKGHVVGLTRTADGKNIHAFLWKNGKMEDIGTLPDGSRNVAYGVNDVGDAAGQTCASQTRGGRALLWRNGQVINLGTLPDGVSSHAWAINNRGAVAGWSTCGKYWGAYQIPYAFVWDAKRGMQDLGTLDTNRRSYTYSIAYDINDAGSIVGQSDNHPFLYQNGKMRDLGTISGNDQAQSQAFGINNRTDIVGMEQFGSVTYASLWQNERLIDLDRCIPSNSGWHLVWARSINDTGQIAGTETIGGQYHAFLLTPTKP